MRDKKKNLYTVISSPKQSNVIRFKESYLLIITYFYYIVRTLISK